MPIRLFLITESSLSIIVDKNVVLTRAVVLLISLTAHQVVVL